MALHGREEPRRGKGVSLLCAMLYRENIGREILLHAWKNGTRAKERKGREGKGKGKERKGKERRGFLLFLRDPLKEGGARFMYE